MHAHFGSSFSSRSRFIVIALLTTAFICQPIYSQTAGATTDESSRAGDTPIIRPLQSAESINLPRSSASGVFYVSDALVDAAQHSVNWAEGMLEQSLQVRERAQADLALVGSHVAAVPGNVQPQNSLRTSKHTVQPSSLSATGIISGRVSDSNGDPIEGITVYLNGYVGGGVECTNANGEYQFNADLNVTYRVHAANVGDDWCGGSNTYAHQYWENKLTWDLADTITLTPANAVREGVDFVLQPGGSISGHVYQQDGVTPVISACINIYVSALNWGQIGAWGHTGADGSFTIWGVPTGTVYINTNHNCLGLDRRLLNEWYAPGSSTPDGNLAGAVTIVAGQTTSNINFQLDDTGLIRGRVTNGNGDPVADMPVSLHGEGISPTSCTDANGDYALGAQYGVGYRVRALNMGESGCSGSLITTYAHQYWSGQLDWGTAAIITATVEYAIQNNINFVLQPGGGVSGHVYQADGVTPVNDVCINFTSSATDWQSLGDWRGTAPDGSFTIWGVPTGTVFLITRQNCGHQNRLLFDEWYAPGGSTSDGNQAGAVTILAGQLATSIDFQLDASGLIGGRVTDMHGAAIADMPVGMSGNGYINQACTNANGEYVFLARFDVPWRVQAAPNGISWCGSPNGYATQYWHNKQTAESADSITLTPTNAVRNDIDFVLQMGGGVAGHVYASDGTTPIAGAGVQVRLRDSNEVIAGASSQADGSYIINGVANNTNYNVTADANGYGGVFYPNSHNDTHAVPITVTASNVTNDINFTLSPEATITGHVYQAGGSIPISGANVLVFPYYGGLMLGTLSAQDGSYTVHGLASGSYRVLAFGSGFEWEYYQHKLQWHSADPISAVSSANTSGIDFTLTQPTPPPTSERLALEGFYTATNGSAWLNTQGWLSNPDICQWNGIQCHSGHVVGIQLNHNNLSGHLPVDWSGLPELNMLWIEGNPLTGTIPSGLGDLAKLAVLNLADNQLNGTIPTQLTGLLDMSYLVLAGNNLTGTIPVDIGNLNKLHYLDLSQNRLSGTVPASLANLTNIANAGDNFRLPNGNGLSLDYNHLTVPDPYPPVSPTTLSSYLAQKNPDWYKTQIAETAVPTSGTVLVSQDDQITVTFASNTVITTTTFEIVPQASPLTGTGSLQFANTSFQLHALDGVGNPVPSYTFSQPVTITLVYTDSDIVGTEEALLALYYWDTVSSAWRDAATSCSPVSTYVREMPINRLSVAICHLSEFALMGIKNEYMHKLYLPVIWR